MTSTGKIQPPIFPFEPGTTIPFRSNLLKNGIPVFTIEAGTEEVMRIEFIFRAGMIREHIPLLASATNMMLTEGSDEHSSEELNGILDYYGIFLNLVVEKDTAGIVIYFLTKYIEKALQLAKEILFGPVFPEHELNILMKKRLRWYLVNREKVQTLAMDQFFESVFGSDHAYGRQVKENEFEGLVPSLLQEFHSRFYRPENMAVIVSGRVSEMTEDLLNSCFGDLASKENYIKEPQNVIKAEGRKKVRIDKAGAIQSAVRIGSSTINKRHPDYPGMKFLNVILGGYFGSRLMKNLREEKGYTYGIHSAVSSLNLSGFKVISAEVNRKNTSEAVDEIYKEIRLLQSTLVENNEMTVVKNYVTGEIVRMFDGPFALAESFKAVWEFGLDSSYYHLLADKIKTITPDEVNYLAGTYYKIEDLYEIIAG